MESLNKNSAKKKEIPAKIIEMMPFAPDFKTRYFRHIEGNVPILKNCIIYRTSMIYDVFRFETYDPTYNIWHYIYSDSFILLKFVEYAKVEEISKEEAFIEIL